MEEYSAEVPINVIQALSKALIVHKPTIIRRRKFKQEEAEKLDKGSKKLMGITLKAHEVLLRANTVFPFNLFPDTITIDREKLTIANRFFFGVAKIASAPIRDILSVEADVGPFFGSVHITSRYFSTNPNSIKFLWRNDTFRVQRLLQGYIIAHEQDIDCSKMSKEQLIVLLEDLGKGDTD